MNRFMIALVFLVSSCLAQSFSQFFQQALLKENGEGDLKAAVALYEIARLRLDLPQSPAR